VSLPNDRNPSLWGPVSGFHSRSFDANAVPQI
jgi:hypothetical protein